MTKPNVSWPRLNRDLVAILRGITTTDVESVVGALVEAGFEAIEIPLNSPDPFASIEKARRIAPANCMIGAGTVLTPEDVDRLYDCGGNLVVTPNTDPAVITRAVSRDMVTMPGAFTATEALAAIRAGAAALKFFPANVLGPKGIGAIRAILPPDIPLGAVGGVAEGDFADYMRAGVRCFGLGSSLYKPGDKADVIKERAERVVRAYDDAIAGN